ncbi:MAG TPA: hypothetical protein VIR57_13435, partial [Chloroflexota bacterium]
MPINALYKYTPGQASPEQLEATTVAREPLLRQILQRLREWRDGQAPEHYLLAGPRGIGKTHLLLLLEHRLKGPEWVGVRVAAFPEESYQVSSAGELLLKIWELVRDPGEPSPPPSSQAATWAERRLRGLADRGVRVLVLLDGFDLLLDQCHEEDEATLRHVLSVSEHIMLVAAASRIPVGVMSRDRPLFEFFHREQLRPLSAGEAEELLHKHAEINRDPLLERWRQLRPRLRALADLAGGTPRLMLMLYDSLHVDQLPNVASAFRQLLDELTPFFKHRVEDLPSQERKLLSLAAAQERGASPSQLAIASGIQERQVAVLLGRLERSGYLRRVRRPGSRTSSYPFTERLLQMWLQMRSSREGERRLACLVEFFRVWYAHAEEEYLEAVGRAAGGVREMAARSGLVPAEDLAISLDYLVRAAPSRQAADKALSQLAKSGMGFRELRDWIGEQASRESLVEPTLYESSFATRSAAPRRLQEADDDVVAVALGNKGVTLGELGRSEDAMAVYDEIVARFGDRTEAGVAEQVARALAYKGVTLGELGRPEDEMAVYDEVVVRFGDRTEAGIAELVARALAYKGVTLGELGRPEDAMAVYDEVVVRFGDRTEAGIA